MSTRLNPEDLQVTSFETASISGLPYCCTGCDSGCGIFPTNSTCESESRSGTAMCFPQEEIGVE